MSNSGFAPVVTRLTRLPDFARHALTVICRRMVTVLRENTPGTRLPDEWTYSVETSRSRVSARVWTQRLDTDPEFKEILFYLDLGTSAHWVAPVHAQALHWIDKQTGEHRFSKGHRVSGIRASHFVAHAERVLAEGAAQLPAWFDRYMQTGQMPA